METGKSPDAASTETPRSVAGAHAEGGAPACRFLTDKDVARLLAIGRSTLWRMRKEVLGFPPLREVAPGTRRTLAADLDAFIRSRPIVQRCGKAAK
jgi:predicted DNA-binding transcriptional regulator AlpA